MLLNGEFIQPAKADAILCTGALASADGAHNRAIMTDDLEKYRENKIEGI